MIDKTKILDKVKKCLALSKSANENEAATALRQARKLMGRTMKKIYLSGPMIGVPALNFPVFVAEATRLRALGYTVVNPAEDTNADYHSYLRRAVAALMDCDTLALLPGWEKSNGVRLKQYVARRVGIRIVDAASIAQINLGVDSQPAPLSLE